MTDTPPATPLPGSQSILIVDDVGVVRESAFRILSEAGYRVYDASSAEEALEVLELARQPIDLALVDVVLPELGGMQLVRILATRWPQMRVLYMSAYQADVLAREGLEHPAVRFLPKPFTRDELLNGVRAALSAARPGGGGGSAAPPRRS
jgi:two-component system, cell cycle sensor histidine kinase and response regulator CckA